VGVHQIVHQNENGDSGASRKSLMTGLRHR
jgi:hypothetical protein